MKTQRYKFQRVLRAAKRAGQRDGKSDLPKNDWDKGTIPYLSLLHSQYIDRKEANILAFKSQLTRMEQSRVGAQQEVIKASSALVLAENRFDEADRNVKSVEREIDGELEDMPASLPAKRRNLGTFPYFIILVICTMAELLVTIPALQFLLGEKRQYATLLAFALGTATFFGAHFIGTTLKKRQDRSIPQPKTDILLIVGLASILFFTILFLAYVRANQTLPFAGNFVELPDSWKLNVLWTIWAIWQITFFCVALVASFKHHSETISKLNKAKRVRFIRRRQLERAKSSLSKSSASFESLKIDWKPSLTKELDEVAQTEKLLLAHYKQACALYVDNNIHSRRQSIKGDHPAFESPEMQLSEIDSLVPAPGEGKNIWDVAELESVGGRTQ